MRGLVDLPLLFDGEADNVSIVVGEVIAVCGVCVSLVGVGEPGVDL